MSKRQAAVMADSSTTVSAALLVPSKTFAKELSRAHVSYAVTVKSVKTFVPSTVRKLVRD